MTVRNKHVNLAIGCSPEQHTKFYMDGYRFICDDCGQDFTYEMYIVYKSLTDMFRFLGIKEFEDRLKDERT